MATGLATQRTGQLRALSGRLKKILKKCFGAAADGAETVDGGGDDPGVTDSPLTSAHTATAAALVELSAAVGPGDADADADAEQAHHPRWVPPARSPPATAAAPSRMRTDRVLVRGPPHPPLARRRRNRTDQQRHALHHPPPTATPPRMVRPDPRRATGVPPTVLDRPRPDPPAETPRTPHQRALNPTPLTRRLHTPSTLCSRRSKHQELHRISSLPPDYGGPDSAERW